MSEVEHPIFYFDGERPVYRASAVGQCLRALTAARIGYEPLAQTDFLALAAKEGKRHEEWIIGEMTAEGWTITRRQETINIRLPAFDIRGHIDGVAVWRSGENAAKYLLEIKTMSRFRFSTFKRQGFAAFPEYAAQVTVYHKAIQLPILYMVKCRDTGEIDRYELPKPPKTFEEVYDRLLTVEILGRKGRLADPPNDCQPFDRNNCPYRYLCESERRGWAP
ncbi:MAG: hypothetical protein ACP5LD_10485 [Desulfomonilaceae bacterium]